jgi:hypothetical protein
MTICIVGICDSKNGIAKRAIAIADRMITAGDTEFEQTGVHPKNWTKYVRVMTGSWSPDGEKGSCHEKPTALFSRT